jgi:integrase
MGFLDEYRERLEGVETVRAELVIEILDVAEAELKEAHGEYTIAQAVERTGKSRSWFERRLETWAANGLARKPGRDWLIKAAALPNRRRPPWEGFDPAQSDDEILRQLAADDRHLAN